MKSKDSMRGGAHDAEVICKEKAALVCSCLMELGAPFAFSTWWSSSKDPSASSSEA